MALTLLTFLSQPAARGHPLPQKLRNLLTFLSQPSARTMIPGKGEQRRLPPSGRDAGCQPVDGKRARKPDGLAARLTLCRRRIILIPRGLAAVASTVSFNPHWLGMVQAHRLTTYI